MNTQGVVAAGHPGRVQRGVPSARREAAGRVKNPGREEPRKPHFCVDQPRKASWRKGVFHVPGLGAFCGQARVPSSGTSWQFKQSGSIFSEALLRQRGDSHSPTGSPTGSSEPRCSGLCFVKWVACRPGVMPLDELLEEHRKGVIIGVCGPSFLPVCLLKVLLWQGF